MLEFWRLEFFEEKIESEECEWLGKSKKDKLLKSWKILENIGTKRSVRDIGERELTHGH